MNKTYKGGGYGSGAGSLKDSKGYTFMNVPDQFSPGSGGGHFLVRDPRLGLPDTKTVNDMIQTNE